MKCYLTRGQALLFHTGMSLERKKKIERKKHPSKMPKVEISDVILQNLAGMKSYLTNSSSGLICRAAERAVAS